MCIRDNAQANRMRNGVWRCALVVFTLHLCTTSVHALEPQNTGWFRGAELTWSPQAQAPDARPRFHALVIGINEYQAHSKGSGWEPLLTSRPDAEAVARLLEQEYGFEVQRLVDR